VLIFDIDNTISPTNPTEAYLARPHETEKAGGFNISISTSLLELFRERDDIALLSTWRDLASDVPRAFGFKADTLVMPASLHGVEGKRWVVERQSGVRVWADDHLRAEDIAWCRENGVHAIKPRTGTITDQALAKMRRVLSE